MTQVAVFYAIKWICGVSAFGCGYMCMGVCVCVHTEIHKKSRSSERWHTRRASSHQSEKQVFSNQPSFLAYFLCRLTAQTSFTCRPPALSPDPILLKVTPSDNLQVLFSVFATFGLFFPQPFLFHFTPGVKVTHSGSYAASASLLEATQRSPKWLLFCWICAGYNGHDSLHTVVTHGPAVIRCYF